jgi:uncharacterized membrane protein HdeD (DUF308 family)
MVRLFQSSDIESLHAKRGWFVGLGIVFMVLGLLSLLLPFVASLVTTIALGWLIVLAGLSEGYHALQNRGWSGAGWQLLSAVIQIIAGGYLVIFPLAGKVVLTLAMGAYLVAEGVLKVARALQHRGVYAWGWLVFDGLLSIALGLYVFWRWPAVALWMLGVLVGINLFMGGSSMLLLGLGGARRAAAARP